MMMAEKILAASLSLVLAGAEPSAQPQTQDPLAVTAPMGDASGCPNYGITDIEALLYDGRIMVSHTTSSVDMAYKKKRKYNKPMPVRQGNIGGAVFRVETDVGVDTYPATGCIFVKGINVKVFLDYKIDIAREYPEGSCIYDEFYNLEAELMAQDEELVNAELQKLQGVLNDKIGEHNIFRPRAGQDIDDAAMEKKKEIETMIQQHVDLATGVIASARKESDLPEFFDEIEAGCAGEQR